MSTDATIQININCCNQANYFRSLQRREMISIVATRRNDFYCCNKKKGFRLIQQ